MRVSDDSTNQMIRQLLLSGSPYASFLKPGMPDSGPSFGDRIRDMGSKFRNLAPPLSSEDPFASFPPELPSGLNTEWSSKPDREGKPLFNPYMTPSKKYLDL
jgi:hypothetical protein